MNEKEVLALSRANGAVPVRVTANDYAYDGYLVSAFRKRKHISVRCVVEDDNGRLFIHNPAQLAVR